MIFVGPGYRTIDGYECWSDRVGTGGGGGGGVEANCGEGVEARVPGVALIE